MYIYIYISISLSLSLSVSVCLCGMAWPGLYRMAGYVVHAQFAHMHGWIHTDARMHPCTSNGLTQLLTVPSPKTKSQDQVTARSQDLASKSKPALNPQPPTLTPKTLNP